MSERPRIPRGSICHIEVPAPDIAALQAFYGEVFGWTFQPMSAEYVIFQDGVGGGGLDASMPVGAGGAVLVMAVDDIEAKLAEIAARGGEALSGRIEIGGGHGSCAYFRDPCGNRMGIWQGAAAG